MLILMAGLPGTGKSHVARLLAKKLNAVILSKDTVRHALFPPELIEYSTEQDDFVVDLLLRTAAYIWKRDPERTIILDGRTFSRTAQRRQAIDFAQRAEQKWKLIECVCEETVAKRRLATGAATHPAENRTPELYDEVKARWEPIKEAHLGVLTDATTGTDHVVDSVIRLLST